MSKSKRKIKSQLSKYRRSSEDIPAKMGNYANQLYVPNRSNYVYVRLQDGTVIDVYNVRVTPKLGLEVWIGYLEKEPHLLQVTSARNGQARFGDTGNPYTSVQPHHLTHEWLANQGGNDVVFTQLRQFMPLRPTPSGGMMLGIYRGIGRLGSSWVYFSGSSIDLSPYVPSTGSLFALVYETANGTPAAVAGTLRDTSTLSLADIPAPVAGTFPIAAIRLYGGQTGIAEARTTTDLVDLRFPMWQGNTSTGTVGGSSAWNDITGKPAYFPAAIPIFNSGVFKVTGTAIDFGSNIDVSVTGTIAYINVTGTSQGSGNVTIRKNTGADIGSRPRINFIEGQGIGIQASDDAGSNEFDVTFSFTGTASTPFNGIPIYDDSVFKVTGTSLAFGTNIDVSATGSMAYINVPAMKRQAVYTFAGTLATDVGAIRIYNQFGFTLTISEVHLSVGTAPASQAIIVDVNKGGVTIFTNQAHRPQIAAAANTGNTTTIDISSWADDEYLTVDIDQVGTGTLGSNLSVTIVCSG